MTKERYLSALIHHLSQKELSSSDAFILKVFNGVDDIDDNCAAVQLFHVKNKYKPVVAGVSIPEHEAGGEYINIAVEVAKEFLAYLKQHGFENVEKIETLRFR